MRIQLFTVALEWLHTADIPAGPVPDVILWESRGFVRNDMLDILNGTTGYIEAVVYPLEH